MASISFVTDNPRPVTSSSSSSAPLAIGSKVASFVGSRSFPLLPCDEASKINQKVFVGLALKQLLLNPDQFSGETIDNLVEQAEKMGKEHFDTMPEESMTPVHPPRQAEHHEELHFSSPSAPDLRALHRDKLDRALGSSYSWMGAYPNCGVDVLKKLIVDRNGAFICQPEDGNSFGIAIQKGTRHVFLIDLDKETPEVRQSPSLEAIFDSKTPPSAPKPLVCVQWLDDIK